MTAITSPATTSSKDSTVTSASSSGSACKDKPEAEVSKMGRIEASMMDMSNRLIAMEKSAILHRKNVSERLQVMEESAELHHEEALSAVQRLPQHQTNQKTTPAPATTAPKLAFDEVFNWVSQDTVYYFKQKLFKMEDFLNLRDPAFATLSRPSKRTRFTLDQDGNLEAEQEGYLDDFGFFLKSVPTLGVLLHLWSTYTAMAVFYSDEPKELSLALNKFAQEIADLQAIYTWKNVCSYFYAVCQKRFNRANAQKWAQRDYDIYQDCLHDRR